jgi:RHS repeat-associated protein
VAHYENGETYFMHANSIGATAFVTDYTGAIVQDELHYPWGQEWTMQGTVEQERFASLQHRDSETSLDPTHYRMYSSSQYRWFTPNPMQADIFRAQSMSRYSYAGGNATNLTDPTGLFAYCPYGETNNQCNPPPDSQYYINFSYYEWSCMINNCMLYGGLPTVSGGGGGAPAPVPKPAPPTIGPPPPPPQPIHTGSYVDYLACVADEGLILGFGNSDRAFATLGLNLAPFVLGEVPPVGIAAGAIATVYDLKLEFEMREICMEEVYGHP